MIKTRIVAQEHNVFRVTIPLEYAKNLNIKKGSIVSLELGDKSTVILKNTGKIHKITDVTEEENKEDKPVLSPQA